MKVVWLSAHLDDAILSAGGLIFDQSRDEKDTVEVWTFMCGGANEIKRTAEDRRACDIVGALQRCYGFYDAVERLDPGGNRIYPTVFADIHEADESLVESVASIIDTNVRSDDLLMCPLAVGGHVDHLIVREACERLVYRTTYYVDFPYIDYVPEKLESAHSGLIRYTQDISEEGLRHWKRAVQEYVSQDLYPTPEITQQKIEEYWAKLKGIHLYERISLV